MTRRFLASIGAIALALAAPAAAQTAKPKTASLPRTPDGHPDLQGY